NGILGEIAASAGRTDTFPGERYRRLARRRGKRKAVTAVARPVLVIVFHLLADPEARFCDLGPDYYNNRISRERKIAGHVRQLQPLGLPVPLPPADAAAYHTPPSPPTALTARTSQGRCRAPTKGEIYRSAEGRRFDPAPDHSI